MLIDFNLVQCVTFLSIFASIFQSTVQADNSPHYCPFVELASFGSDIEIRCNETYLIFNENNADQVNWKFANQISTCRQKGTQQAALDHCNITRIASNYLTVPLKSIDHEEIACVYCRINYVPISPIVSVTSNEDDDYIVYTFNLTTNRLAPEQSFEILWTKRASFDHYHSITYWFTPRCVSPTVTMIESTGHSVVFSVEEVQLGRVEFLIRYCNGLCRSYRKCDEMKFMKEVSSTFYPTPNSIEKISCDQDCLNDDISPTTTTRTSSSSISSSSLPTTIARKKTPPKRNLFVTSLGIIVIILILLLVGILIGNRIRVARQRHIYTKTSHQTSNEGTSSVE